MLEKHRLKKALKEGLRFAWHKVDCGFIRPPYSSTCTCGYRSWLERIESLLEGKT